MGSKGESSRIGPETTCAAASLLLLPLLPLLLLQVYGADEAFATGTFAGLLPVVEVDGRRIGSGAFVLLGGGGGFCQLFKHRGLAGPSCDMQLQSCVGVLVGDRKGFWGGGGYADVLTRLLT